MKERSTDRTRNGVVERRLARFASLRLDPAEVQASRDFHFQHWLKVAEAAIRKDHRELYYGALTPNLQALVADYPDDKLPPEVQETILKDLAFMEGHLAALRKILALLRTQ